MNSSNHWHNIKKLYRFFLIYGPRKTLFKAMGRTRKFRVSLLFPFTRTPSKDIAVIGCGQFAFATIGYYLMKAFGNRFKTCHDTCAQAMSTFSLQYGIFPATDIREHIFENDLIKTVYIASNHASHADYAIQALEAGKDVYVEKPIAVSYEQLVQILKAVQLNLASRIFAGYNRPHSTAVKNLKSWCSELNSPLTLSCFISGHVLGPDHWYRDPAEGTRVCGNVGHWLDLAVHMLKWGTLPDRWRINISWSNGSARDDDMAITLTSERGDLINIVLTARTEPFEGINETINLQWGDTVAKIDDFRTMTVWKGSISKKYRFWPKNVGHEAAIMQPYSQDSRDWHEVELSTILMLKVAAMVTESVSNDEFSFVAEWRTVEARIKKS